MNIVPQRRVLKNGVALNTVKTEKFKTNRLSVNFIFPLVAEDAPYYALLPEIFKNGCRLYPSTESLAKKLEDMYAASLGIHVTKNGENEILSFSLELLRNRYTENAADLLQEGFMLLFSMLSEPLLNESGDNFPTAVMAREKNNLLTRVRSVYNNKIQYALDRCRSLMCSSEPYSVSADGSEEGVAAMEISRVYGYYQRLLTASRVEIYFIGDETPARIEELVAPLAAFLTPREVSLLPASTASPRERVQDIEEKDSTVQSKLCMGYRFYGLPEALVPYLAMFQSVISGSPVSKYFKNVREKLSLCYYCSMTLDSVKRVAFVSSGIEKEKKAVAVRAIEDQLAEMRKGNITETEMEYGRRYLLDAYPAITDDARSIEGICLKLLLKNEGLSLDDLIQNAKNATSEHLSEIAKYCTLDTVFFLKAEGADNGGEEEAL